MKITKRIEKIARSTASLPRPAHDKLNRLCLAFG